MSQYPLWNQLNTLKEAQWVDLTHTFDPNIPRFSEFEKGEVSTLFNVKDHGFYVQRWSIVTQYGTHIDAPIHFVENRRYLEELDLKELVLPLIVLDYSKEAAQNSDFIVSRKHLEDWEQQHGRIEAGTFVEERGVKSIGHETFDTDASIDTAKNGDIVGERYILGQDTFQVELLTNLDQLPTRGAIIYAISPKPKDAPGFPVRAFAIKP